MKFIKIIALMLVLIGSENALLGSNRITARNVYTGKNKRTFLSATTFPAIPAQKDQSSVKKKPAAPAPQANATASTWVPDQQDVPKRVKRADQQKKEQTKTNDEALIQTQKNAPPKKAASENAALTLATPAQTMNTVALAAATACAMASAATSACAAPKADDVYQATMLELFGEDWQLDSPKAPHSAALQQSVQTEKSLQRKAQIALAARKSTASKINGEIVFLKEAGSAVTPSIALRENESGNSDEANSDEDINSGDEDASDEQAKKGDKSQTKKQRRKCTFPGCNTTVAYTAFSRHLLRHTRKTKMQCPRCPTQLACKTSLDRHLKNHDANNAGSFKCNVCSNLFTTRQSLACHKRFHVLPEIPCTICGEKFGTKTALKAHSKLH